MPTRCCTAPVIRVVHVCPPICIQTDLSNFQAVVQELTGKRKLMSTTYEDLQSVDHDGCHIRSGHIDHAGMPAVASSPTDKAESFIDPGCSTHCARSASDCISVNKKNDINEDQRVPSTTARESSIRSKRIKHINDDRSKHIQEYQSDSTFDQSVEQALLHPEKAEENRQMSDFLSRPVFPSVDGKWHVDHDLLQDLLSDLENFPLVEELPSLFY